MVIIRTCGAVLRFAAAETEDVTAFDPGDEPEMLEKRWSGKNCTEGSDEGAKQPVNGWKRSKRQWLALIRPFIMAEMDLDVRMTEESGSAPSTTSFILFFVGREITSKKHVHVVRARFDTHVPILDELFLKRCN